MLQPGQSVNWNNIPDDRPVFEVINLAKDSVTTIGKEGLFLLKLGDRDRPPEEIRDLYKRLITQYPQASTLVVEHTINGGRQAVGVIGFNADKGAIINAFAPPPPTQAPFYSMDQHLPAPDRCFIIKPGVLLAGELRLLVHMLREPWNHDHPGAHGPKTA